MIRNRHVSGAAMALLLTLLAGAGAAWAAGHAETLVTFDPEQGQLPEGVAVDAAGDVYASLATLGQLVRVPAGSSEAELVGSIEGLAEGEFGPVGLAVDARGDIYAGVMSANPKVNGIWRFDAATDAVERVPGSEAITFANDVAIADDGTLYATDTIAGAVWRVTPGGPAEPWIEDELLAGTGEAGFGFPIGANGIAVDGDTVYVGVTEQAHVVAVPINEDGSAGAAVLFAELPEAVDGIAIDADGDLISAHPLANLITRRSPDGEIEVIADASDGLDRPSTIALRENDDGTTTVYVANFSVAMGSELGNGPSIVALELLDEAGSMDSSATSATDGRAASVSVTAGDLWFEPTTVTVSSGATTTIMLVNEGRVVHNLIVDELGLAVTAAPGGSGQVDLIDTPPGEYVFYCSIFGHRQAGMAGSFVVE